MHKWLWVYNIDDPTFFFFKVCRLRLQENTKRFSLFADDTLIFIYIEIDSNVIKNFRQINDLSYKFLVLYSSTKYEHNI